MSSDVQKAVRNKALRFLARREYATTELQRRLIQAGFAVDDIAVVLTALIEEKLLSNARFIENYIHFRRQKGFGPLRIAAELNEKGLNPEEYESLLQAPHSTWLTDVRLAWEKRFKNKMPVDFSEQAKQMRFLQGRGFTGEQIKFLFKKI